MEDARPLRAIAGVVSRRPGAAIAVLVVVSVALGSFATRMEQETDFEAFAPGGDAAVTLRQVRSEFGAGGATVQILVDAGPDGNVLSRRGIEGTERVVQVVQEALGDRSAGTGSAVRSYAAPIRSALTIAGAGEDPPPEVLSNVVTATLSSPAGAQLAGLLSSDLDVEQASARAGLAVAPLDEELSDDEAVQAALDARRAVDDLDLDGIEARVFGRPLLEHASAELTSRELPRLLGLSLVLITVVLFLVFRRLADVAVGVAGLALALAWTYGFGSLLGPGWLGWTGPFNQITTVVPILVAGLGIDFALHLTMRRREERTGTGPRRAAGIAIATVGGALALTSVTTTIGFLTNLASPVAPVRDFGVFTAVGVVSSFVVMLVLVPAAGALLDRRRANDHDEAAGSDRDAPSPLPLVGPIARVSIAHPVAVVAATVAVSIAAVIAGLSVPTTFDPDDFIPSGSRVAATVDQVQDLFGADVSERTYVLLDGPLQQPEVADAITSLPERLADVDGVRTAPNGRALVETPVTLVRDLASRSSDTAEVLRRRGWQGDGFSTDADVAGIYRAVRERAPERSSRYLEADGDRQLVVISTSAGQDDAAALASRIDDQLRSLRGSGVDVRITGQHLVFAATVDALTSSQVRSIGITVGAAAFLLVAFFWWRERSPILGAIAMLPTVLVATWVVGSMWVLGLSFNVLTITIGSLAIAIGVDYGIHIAYRFREEHGDRPLGEAIRHTVEQTGGALAGSAATTAVGFGVLTLSSIVPIRQFGTITALTIAYSVVAAVVVVPAVLRLRWSTNGPPSRPEEAGHGRV